MNHGSPKLLCDYSVKWYRDPARQPGNSLSCPTTSNRVDRHPKIRYGLFSCRSGSLNGKGESLKCLVAAGCQARASTPRKTAESRVPLREARAMGLRRQLGMVSQSKTSVLLTVGWAANQDLDSS